MCDSDSMELKIYKKAKELFYEYDSKRIRENAIEIANISYEKGYFPVMFCKSRGEEKGKILLHGGNDSYIEEFFDTLFYLKNRFDVYLFEGLG